MYLVRPLTNNRFSVQRVSDKYWLASRRRGDKYKTYWAENFTPRVLQWSAEQAYAVVSVMTKESNDAPQ